MPLGRLARKSGHAVVSPISEMKSRRLICPPANHRSGRDYSRKKSSAEPGSATSLRCKIPGPQVSPLGQKRRFRPYPAMSAMPPKAT